MNATEKDIGDIVNELRETVPGNLRGELDLLSEAAEMGLMGYRVVLAIKPLVTAVWVSMNERGDQNRFAVERMLRDIDRLINFWIVADNEGCEGDDKESDGVGC